MIWARRILAEHDAFKAEVQAVKSGVTGTLRLGAVPTASTTAALPIEAFAAVHPLASIRVQTRLSSDDLLRMIADFEIDAAIMAREPAESAGLESVALYEEEHVLVVPQELLPDRSTTMSWTEAHGLPLVLLDQRMYSRRLIDRAFAERGVVIAPQVETDSVASLHALVRTGRWASIVPRSWFYTRAPAPNSEIIVMPEPVARVRDGRCDQRRRARFPDRPLLRADDGGTAPRRTQGDPNDCGTALTPSRPDGCVDCAETASRRSGN